MQCKNLIVIFYINKLSDNIYFGINSRNTVLTTLQEKVNKFHYRPGVVQRIPGSLRSQISCQRHRMVVRLSALRTDRLYPEEILLILISVKG